jgi:hypothetical protein
VIWSLTMVGEQYYQGAVCRPKEGLEVVLVYSNEGVQDRTRSGESQKQELSNKIKKKVVIAGIERMYE